MSSTRSRPSRGELLAPAGDLASGLLALEAGADALYLGLEEFSARRGARNFSLRDFARIKAAAESKGTRVYGAFNTLIRDRELGRVTDQLRELEARGVDGIIVQDLGLAALIREHFPGLPIHASTQMGIHNSPGVEQARRLGISRVVLSRELSFDEIRQIREDHPDVELEVFVHGALCYSFSGLCLASGLMLGRSANRGECAQVCRTWFEVAAEEGPMGPAGGGTGYFFSCKDLAAREDLLQLRDLGVTSFKIEGRMKPPAWVAAITAYYRVLLDGKNGEEAEENFRRARTIFSRRLSGGHLPGPGTEDLLGPAYPGHRGIPAGKVRAVREGPRPGLVLALETDLAIRDGLLFFEDSRIGGTSRDPQNPGDKAAEGTELPVPVRFSVTEMEISGTRTLSAQAGEEVFIPWTLSDPAVASSRKTPPFPPSEMPAAGTKVDKIGLHDAQVRVPEKNLPERKILLDLRVHLQSDGISLSVPPSPVFPGGLSISYPAAPERARVFRPFLGQARRRLGPPGDSPYALRDFTLTNNSGLPEDGIYLNPSFLKEIRRNFYSALEAERHRAGEELKNAVLRRGKNSMEDQSPRSGELEQDALFTPPQRELLRDTQRDLPFVTDFSGLRAEDLYSDSAGRMYLPLAPVLFEAESYLREAEDFVRRLLRERQDYRLILGLGNLGHLGLVQIFASEERVEFFADYGLYIANRRSLELVQNFVPRLRFYYPWVEEPVPETLPDSPGGAGIPAGQYGDFKAPLFISRICVFRQGFSVEDDFAEESPRAGNSRCRGCSMDRRILLRQRKKTFLLRAVRIAGSCLNLLFPAD